MAPPLWQHKIPAHVCCACKPPHAALARSYAYSHARPCASDGLVAYGSPVMAHKRVVVQPRMMRQTAPCDAPQDAWQMRYGERLCCTLYVPRRYLQPHKSITWALACTTMLMYFSR